VFVQDASEYVAESRGKPGWPLDVGHQEADCAGRQRGHGWTITASGRRAGIVTIISHVARQSTSGPRRWLYLMAAVLALL